jgi:hypothetical protein
MQCSKFGGVERAKLVVKVVPRSHYKRISTSPQTVYLRGGAFFGELVFVLDLFGRELHQVLVDDVADVFEIYRKGDYHHGARSLAVIQRGLGSMAAKKLSRSLLPIGGYSGAIAKSSQI